MPPHPHRDLDLVDVGERREVVDAVVPREACDEPGMGNQLRFRLPEYDQTELHVLLQQLAAVEAAFGVVGTP